MINQPSGNATTNASRIYWHANMDFYGLILSFFRSENQFKFVTDISVSEDTSSQTDLDFEHTKPITNVLQVAYCE